MVWPKGKEERRASSTVGKPTSILERVAGSPKEAERLLAMAKRQIDFNVEQRKIAEDERSMGAFTEEQQRAWMGEKARANPVNHPPHYTFGSIEVIDVIEDWQCGFCDGNAIKYIARHRHKGRPVEDLKKARWYIDREIAKLEALEALAQLEREIEQEETAQEQADRETGCEP